MNIKVVEYSIFAISVIYLICVCRDLQHTNDLQDAALEELTKSLPLLVMTNIDSYHSNNIKSNKIETEKEILNSESVQNKDDDTHQVIMKEDLVHHDETKREKIINMNNGSISRKASHNNYDKHRYGRDVSMIQKYDYSTSFDAANRIKNNKKKTMKEIWPKQNLFPNNVRKSEESQKPVKDNNWKSLNQKQKESLQERKKQLDRINVESRNLNNDNVPTTIRKLVNNLKIGKGSQKKSSEGVEKTYVIEKRRLESFMSDKTSCVLTKADVIYACDDEYGDCWVWELNGYCADDWMIELCPRTCNACPPPVSLFENQVQYEEDDNNSATFNLSLNVNTNSYANETSWLFMSQNSEDSTLFKSSDVNITSQLENNTEYKFNYYCAVHPTEENQLTDDTTSTCYHFEVHDSHGDGMCCEYGGGFFSMNIITNTNSLNIEDQFEEGSVINTSFCIGHDDGEIRSNGRFITTKQPSHYPFRWQCKNGVCLCDSKPSLTTNIHENHVFLFQISMLSDSDKLQDVESAQYKAACWVLYDDPLTDESNHNRKIQRYILALLYFATSPDNWKEHSKFLSSRSECDWNYDRHGSIRGISCDEDDNVISIDLIENNLDGTIVEELSGLRILEELDLFRNNIHGTIPTVLGRLSQLRILNLDWNELGGTIPPQLFNTTNLEELHLFKNRLEGAIPETIGNLQKLTLLRLKMNKLSGFIPNTIYMLKNLKALSLEENKLSSTISPLIGNLNKLEHLYIENNMLTGQIPSTIGSLSSLKMLRLENNRLSGSIPSTIGNMISLEYLFLHNNKLSGKIPESLFDAPKLHELSLQDNTVTGSVPDEFCERFDDYDYYFFDVDCRNDVFDPEVSCDCCTCANESPIWGGDCGDATIKVVIDHGSEWSLVNDATGKKILYDGAYRWEEGIQSYEACVAYSDCFSFNQISPPTFDTNYHIYWNNNSIHSGTFLGWAENDDINWDAHTLLTFSYNEENQKVPSCYDIKLECYENEQPLFLKPNTTERIIYDQAIKLSGRPTVHDISSAQSKALCWMLNNNPNGNKADVLDTIFEQRYVLAILHFMSPDGLFGNLEYLAEKHECDWNGITCKDNNTKNVTGISLSSENNQIISGTLIDEIGSLRYLKILKLNQTQLHGTIPQSFSNLWSLTKLDLSGNKISNTIPTTLFRQLNLLEYINFSNNTLRGSINDDIGSFSRIRSLSLNENEFTGSLPLDGFKHYDLEHLDISGNALSQINFSSLLKHNNLKYLKISSNFFAGSLFDDTFTSLAKLEFFNISQNDFSGTIPSTFPEVSNITLTHFDIHSNRFKGAIPLSITELSKLQHINLQGNQLTGSLPSQMNELKNLDTLVLSHNELKGSIPFDQKKLQKMDRLHLHSNMLSGEAPIFNNMDSYITDCGFPSDLSDPVTCPSCSTCCNSLDRCRVTKVDQGKMNLTLIFSFILIGLLILSYLGKDQIVSLRKFEPFFSRSVSQWNPLTIMNEKSVYHFLLTNNKIGWRIALGTGAFQILTLFLFVVEASSYSLKCPFYSLKCEDTEPGINASPLGLLLFGLILVIWLTRDLVSSVKLLLFAIYKKNIDIMFTGGLVFFITALAAWTSIYYNFATVTTDNELIVNTVILLFVLEADERIYQFAESFTPQWVIDEARFRESAMFDGDELIISSWIRKMFHKRSSLTSQFCKNEEEEEEEEEDEDEGEEGDNGDGSSREMNLNETCQASMCA